MIEFQGVDLILRELMDDHAIQHGLAQALHIQSERIAIISNMELYPERSAADVVCVKNPVSGEFSLLLSIQTERKELPYDSVLELAQRIAQILRTRCLLPVEGSNPYIMWLVSSSESPRRVALEATALEEGMYILRSEER